MSSPADDVNTGGRARRWTVHGRVQGVGFRMFVLEHALRSGLSGYVRNMEDGGVEVMAMGDAVAMEQLESALHAGPRGARVERVEELSLPDGTELPSPFEVRA